MALAAVLALAGCAAPGPKLLPLPLPNPDRADDGSRTRLYDVDQNGAADYQQTMDADGRVAELRFDLDGDGAYELAVRRDAQRDLGGVPHLLIILDSIPFRLVRDQWLRGRFRLFHRPGRVISTFPVMTDPALDEFFGASPCAGLEALYYDGERLVSGFGGYARGGNTPWVSNVDYAIDPDLHVWAYFWPVPWNNHELGQIERAFLQAPPASYIGYTVSTSALGAQHGRDGHEINLIRLDRMCEWIMYALRGRCEITLMSDHGHDLLRSRRVSLADQLVNVGYHVGRRLQRSGDVVVPEFGVVSVAAIHTHEPDSVARDVVGFEGVELAAYRDSSAVVVLSRTGRARITRCDGGYRYDCEFGDPLQLRGLLVGLADADGCYADADLFEATKDHIYPDAIARLWRGFNGLFVHTPDVLVSIADGYHVGDKTLSEILDAESAHGSLRSSGSVGFVMSTVAGVGDTIRMQDLRDHLIEIGVRLDERP